jgi:hypothetical protein
VDGIVEMLRFEHPAIFFFFRILGLDIAIMMQMEPATVLEISGDVVSFIFGLVLKLPNVPS